ncbi:MAG: ABC transporter ATP-binding protein [Verrucomicrobiae bacterium]|nr:ABC transporter ATP-binding protein [Verrucomicrobiae bacterium]
MMSEPLLRAVGVRRSFRLGQHDLEVLRGIDLEVHAGEALVIVGASGAGKSTLLHLLGGLDVPTSGEIWFEGRSLRAMTGAERSRWRNRYVGFVFQSYHLLPELTALENVCVPAWVSGDHAGSRMWERAAELLRVVGLGERLEHRPTELSGGEQQRVALARALMNEPRLLLADEPTGNLDSKTGGMVLDLIWRLRAQFGTTLVMVTHDEHVAQRGDRVLTIADGRILS